jgi:phasin family protein
MTNAIEQLSALGRAQTDAVLRLAAISSDGAGKIAEFQIQSAKAAFEESLKSARSLSALKNVDDLAEWSRAGVQPGIDKAVAQAKSAYGLAVATQAEIGKVLEEQVVEFTKALNVTLDAAAKNAPPGSAPAVEAIRSAIGIANTACESVAKAVRQLAAATEANLAAATAPAVGTKKKAA